MNNAHTEKKDVLQGTLSLLVLVLSGWNHIAIFDAGVAAFVLNGLASVAVAFIKAPSEEERRRIHERFFSLFTTVPQAVPLSRGEGKPLSLGPTAD